jgi:hypothetical protein
MCFNFTSLGIIRSDGSLGCMHAWEGDLEGPKVWE